VFAIITSTTDLASSDFLGDPTVNHLDPENRGLEAGDSVTISGAQQILFDTTASSPGDYVRVLTAVSPTSVTTTPEPSSFVLLGSGLVAVATLIRRRWYS
jgi:hypothetical protein